MEFASLQQLYLHLISSAIRRCRFSQQLSRLSVVLHCSPPSDPPLVLISISDTGLGSCLEEFQDLKCPGQGLLIGDWDGIISVKTTDICDSEIRCYQLNLKENASTRMPIRLPSNVKHGLKFSGTEVCLTVPETIDVLLEEINCFLQKVLILKIPDIAMEVVIKRKDIPGSESDVVFLENLSPSFSSTASTLDNLILGLEDYASRHGSSLVCESCFPNNNRDNLKSGRGMVREEKHKASTLVVEAAIVISDVSNPTNNCFRACASETKVYCFKDFAPCSISEAFLKALTGIDWKSYGLTLESAVDEKSHALLHWENMPLSFHIHIAVHCYQKVMPLVKTTRFDKKIIRRAVKLALDDLKNKHVGFLLSAHSHKISRYAPDLANTIAGLILSSNDSDFKGECLAILGLQPQPPEGEIVEENIRKKIISVIEMNDRKAQGTKDVAPFLFEDDRQHLQPVDDENESNEYGFSPMDSEI